MKFFISLNFQQFIFKYIFISITVLNESNTHYCHQNKKRKSCSYCQFKFLVFLVHTVSFISIFHITFSTDIILFSIKLLSFKSSPCIFVFPIPDQRVHPHNHKNKSQSYQFKST